MARTAPCGQPRIHHIIFPLKKAKPFECQGTLPRVVDRARTLIRHVGTGTLNTIHTQTKTRPFPLFISHLS